MCIKNVDSRGAKQLEQSAASTGNCVSGHKIKTIPSWKTIYPTNGSQIAQPSLRTRLGDPEDSIS